MNRYFLKTAKWTSLALRKRYKEEREKNGKLQAVVDAVREFDTMIRFSIKSFNLQADHMTVSRRSLSVLTDALQKLEA